MENANELTIAYLAMGAITKLDQLNKDDRKQYGGEHEVISRVIGQAKFLDDFFDAHHEVLGEVSFEYEVTEPFGAEFVVSKESPEDILKNVLKGALTKESFKSIYSDNEADKSLPVHHYTGVLKSYDAEKGTLVLEQRNYSYRYDVATRLDVKPGQRVQIDVLKDGEKPRVIGARVQGPEKQKETGRKKAGLEI